MADENDELWSHQGSWIEDIFSACAPKAFSQHVLWAHLQVATWRGALSDAPDLKPESYGWLMNEKNKKTRACFETSKRATNASLLNVLLDADVH